MEKHILAHLKHDDSALYVECLCGITLKKSFVYRYLFFSKSTYLGPNYKGIFTKEIVCIIL